MPQLQSPEIQAFANGFPIALMHIAVTVAILFVGVVIYVLMTPHREIALIREGNSAAALSLGGVLVGLAIPLSASLAGSTGVETADDVVKYLLAGADAVMTTASLIRNGPHHVITLVAGLEAWLERKGFASVAEARGLLALPADGDPDAAERGGYVAAIQAAKARYGTL